MPSRRICKSNRHANASCAVHQTALSLLRGAFFMHRMRARMPRIAFSPLRDAIFLHQTCACMPIIVLSLLRGAIFSGAKPDDCCLSPAGRIFIEMRWLFYNTDLLCETLSFLASRGLWPGPGLGLVSFYYCLLYTSPSPRDPKTTRMPSSA